MSLIDKLKFLNTPETPIVVATILTIASTISTTRSQPYDFSKGLPEITIGEEAPDSNALRGRQPYQSKLENTAQARPYTSQEDEIQIKLLRD